jgi:excinuclease UvrABC nuclease subunit
MPFPTQTPQPFTRAGIEWLAPNQSGVYGIFHTGLWIYVGKADDLRARLFQHLNGDNLVILRHQPTHYVTMVTTDGDAAEKQLTVELQPVANQRLG